MEHSLVKKCKNYYINRINEALGLGSYQYFIPSDPQEILYDFYFLSLMGDPSKIPGLIFNRSWHEGEFKGAYLNDAQIMDLAASVKETQDKLLDYTRKDLLDATYFSITSEFRHVLDSNRRDNIITFAEENGCVKEMAKWIKNYSYFKGENIDNIIKSFLPKDDPMSHIALRARVFKGMSKKKISIDPITGEETPTETLKKASDFLGSSSGRIASYASAKNAWKNNDYEFIDFAESVFNQLKWTSSYGGPAWAAICVGWKRLDNAETNLERMIWIDHIFDLQHNTGTMLNKVKRWSKNGSWDWIKRALDFKKSSTMPMIDFINRISPSMSFLAQRLRYAITGLANDNPAITQLNTKLSTKKLPTNSKVKAPTTTYAKKLSTSNKPFSDIIPGTQVITKSGRKGVIYKIGSSGKPYVDFPDMSLGGTFMLKYDAEGKKPIEWWNAKDKKTTHITPAVKKLYSGLKLYNPSEDNTSIIAVGTKILTDTGVRGTIKKIIPVGIPYLPTGGYIVQMYGATKSFNTVAPWLFIYNSDLKMVGVEVDNNLINDIYTIKCEPATHQTKLTYGLTMDVMNKPTATTATTATTAKSKDSPVTTTGAPVTTGEMPNINNTVTQNSGEYVKLLSKFHPKIVAHTGPAGKGGVKTLVVKLWQTKSNVGRTSFTGYLKMKLTHAMSGDILYYNQKELPDNKKLYIGTFKGGKYIPATDDKAVVDKLAFVQQGSTPFLKYGVIANAVICGPVRLDGNLVLINCKLVNCYITSNGLYKIKTEKCKIVNIVGGVGTDPNEVAKIGSTYTAIDHETISYTYM